MSTPFDISTIIFVLNAIVGALLNVLMWSKRAEDLKKWRAFKTIAIGGLSGYIYWWGYKAHDFPDGFMSILVGYASMDFINYIISKYLHKPAFKNL